MRWREAFKRAERQAIELAGAAGMVLGPVSKLEETQIQNNDVELPMEYVYSQMGGMRVQQASFGIDDKNITEAMGAKPAKVVYRVGVAASFEMSACGHARGAIRLASVEASARRVKPKTFLAH